MRNIDRLLVLFLAVGIWALVLMPKQIDAHDGHEHKCEQYRPVFAPIRYFERKPTDAMVNGIEVHCNDR